MKAKLLAVGGTAKPVEIALTLPAIIGRGHAATLKLPHPLVSRKHCELFERDGKLVVRDLGSLNGTYIGNERVEEAILPPGELLTVGTITFRAVYSDDFDSDATDPSPLCRTAKPADSTDSSISNPEDRTQREFVIDDQSSSSEPVDRKTALRPDSVAQDTPSDNRSDPLFGSSH